MSPVLRRSARRGAGAALLAFVIVINGCRPVHRRTPPTRPLSAATVDPEFEMTAPFTGFIRIGIRENVEKVTVLASEPVNATIDEKGAVDVWPAGSYEFRARGGILAVNGRPRGRKCRLSGDNRLSFLQLNGNGYRGDLVIVARGDTVTAIDELMIDDYLKGVLPREVVVTWHEEALKVQAVASRTYVASHLGKHKASGYDVCSDVHCQAYGGAAREHPRTTAAVDDTRGQILVYKGRPIGAFFHSNCGGSTEEIGPVWGNENRPYLPRKRCSYGTGDPRYTWSVSISDPEIVSALRAKTRVQGKKLSYLRVKEKSPSGRASLIGVATDAGKWDLSGNEFRLAMNPERIRSTLFTKVARHGQGYTFSGRGWGHGVGMCQWGAKGQAEAGHDYRDILSFYYPHTDLRIWDQW